MANALTYAVRFKVLSKYFGQLCVLIGALSSVPFGVSLYFQEFEISVRYAIICAGLIVTGVLLSLTPAPRRIQANEGMVLVALVFLFTSLVMSFPIMSSGVGFLDAFFEAVSGSTTTGLSTRNTLEEAPRSFLFARAWMQWYGGLGIVVLSLALLVEPGLAAKGLGVTESVTDDLVGGMRAYARRIWLVYAVLTGSGIFVLWLFGADIFDAVVYAMAAVSTGGFAPYDESLAGLENGVLQGAVILICLLGSVPLVSYYLWSNLRWRLDVNTLQVCALIVSGILISVLLAISMSGLRTPLLEVSYEALLLAFSAQTTAGFSSFPLSDLNGFSKGVLILAMAVGGGAGSTAGGIKILRALIFLRLLHLGVQRTALTRHAVSEPRIARNRLAEREVREALFLILLFLAVVFVSWLPFLAMGYVPLDSLFEVVSATGTVGLSVGITTHELPDLLKGILCVDMLFGRVEIVAWLVIFYPRTWIGRRMEEL